MSPLSNSTFGTPITVADVFDNTWHHIAVVDSGGSPLEFPRNFNRVSARDANGCSGSDSS